MLRGFAFAIADTEFSEIAAGKVRSLAHAQTGDAQILLDVDILNSPGGEQVCDLLIQERTYSRKVEHVGLLEMREGVFVVKDLQYRKGHQHAIREDAGPGQGKMSLACQAPLERLEFPLRFPVVRRVAPGIPALKQRLGLLD